MRAFEPTPAPGIYRNIAFHEYICWDAVSRSELDHLADSPALYYWNKHERPEPEPPEWIGMADALALGTAIHDAILLGDYFDERYATGPDVNLATKDGKARWQAFGAEHSGKRLLRAEAGQLCHEIRRKVVSTPFANALLYGDGGESEVCIVWDERGRRCKARLDRWAPNMPRGPSVADLKSTRDAEPRRWMRQAIAERLYMQPAWYLRGLRANGIDVPSERFYFLAYEKAAPFESSVHTFDEEYVKDAEQLMDRLLDLLRRCEESGKWPGYGHVVNTISRPAYDAMVGRETEILLNAS